MKFSTPLFICVFLLSEESLARKWKHRSGGRRPDRPRGDLEGIPEKLRSIMDPEGSRYYQYNPFVKPNGHVGVNVTMFIRAMMPISKKTKTMKLQVTYREKFYDHRLATRHQNSGWDDSLRDPSWDDGRLESGSGVKHDHGRIITVSGQDFDNIIWTPDTFFRNSVDEHVLGAIKPNVYARIDQNGLVLVSRRINLNIYCPDVANFDEVGRSSCKLMIASYGYTKDQLSYHWDPNNPITTVDGTNSYLTWDSAQSMGRVDDAIVRLSSYDTSTCDVTTSTGRYSCIALTLNLAKDS